MPATILLQTKLVLPYSHKKPAIAMEYSYLDYCSGQDISNITREFPLYRSSSQAIKLA
jgi:hypothetical protein